ncbi:hypothetical protein JHK84_034167 [Glycine max]|nr:hypothetical protein JHK84_034167 [Glycine max]
MEYWLKTTKGGAGGFHEGVMVEELDGNNHGVEDVDNLHDDLPKGNEDDNGVDILGEEETVALLEECTDNGNHSGFMIGTMTMEIFQRSTASGSLFLGCQCNSEGIYA